MHALGLKHLFSEKDKNGKLANEGKKHLFKKTKTKNYMDYDNVKRLTWQWQWKKLHNYSYLK